MSDEHLRRRVRERDSRLALCFAPDDHSSGHDMSLEQRLALAEVLRAYGMVPWRDSGNAGLDGIGVAEDAFCNAIDLER